MNSLIKFCVTITSLFFLSIVISCSNGEDSNAHSILGIYAVADRTCKGTDSEVAACQAIAFIEVVKGNFYGVSDNEIAFVIWSGEKGSDLTYIARKYKGSTTFGKNPVKELIGEDSTFREEVSFTAEITSYTYEKRQDGETVKSTLILKRALPDELAEYHMEHPGNN